MRTTTRLVVAGCALLVAASPAHAASSAQGKRPPPAAAPAPAPAPGVALSVSVAGARVLLDGKVVAESAPQQLVVAAAAGEHALRVEREGFEPWEGRVAVGPGAPAKVDVLLKVARAPEPPPSPATKERRETARGVRVAVYEAKAEQGIEPRVVRLVSEALLAEIRKLERVSAVSMNEIGEMLSFEQQRQLLGCGDDSCLAEISGALGVDELVTVNLGLVGDSRLFTLKRIDMRRAVVKASPSRRFKAGTGEEFLAAVGPTVEEAFPEYPLRAGRTRGVSPAVVARLNPPPLPRWAFYSTAGAAALAAVAGGVAGLWFQEAQGRFDDAMQRARTTEVPASEVNVYMSDAVSRARTANTAFIVAGGLALVAGVEAFFTDWAGARDAAPGSGGDAPVSVQVGADGLSVGVRGAW